jgi:hypothetical protein
MRARLDPDKVGPLVFRSDIGQRNAVTSRKAVTGNLPRYRRGQPGGMGCIPRLVRIRPVVKNPAQ